MTGFRVVERDRLYGAMLATCRVLTFPVSVPDRKIAKNQAIILDSWEIMRIFARFWALVCVCERVSTGVRPKGLTRGIRIWK